MRADEKSREDANRKFAANVSPRAVRLDRFERYARATQYVGRPSFWDDSVPLPERAPIIFPPIPERAAESNVDMCFGEGRAPTFSLCANEDDVFDDRLALSEDDAELATKFIAAACEQADFIFVLQELLAWAQMHGTTCAVAGARNGRLCVDRIDAKWCTPTFDPRDPDIVQSVEIRYPYIEEYVDDSQRQAWRCLLHRRVIDAQRDVTYLPAPASINGMDPDQWIEDPNKVFKHEFGFCPVRWYRFGTCAAPHELDGEAIHARMLSELDALNLAYSQIHRGNLYTTDPQIIETGVDQGYQQAPIGRLVSAQIDAHDNPANASWILYDHGGKPLRQPGGSAMRRGPGTTWRYESSESKVSLLTLPGDAFKPAEDNARRLYGMIKEMLGVVFLDPVEMKFGADISGRALEMLYQKQIDRCNRIRQSFGRGMVVPLLHMLLRVCLRTKAAIYLPGIGKARKVLERFEQEVEGASGPQWFGPEIRLTWGPYFRPTAADAKADTENAIAAKDAGLITLKTAVEALKPHYPSIGDVGQYLDALEDEAQEKAKKFHEAAAALAANGDMTDSDEEQESEPSSVQAPKRAKLPVQKTGRMKSPVPIEKLPPEPPKTTKPKKAPVTKKTKRVAQAEAAA